MYEYIHLSTQNSLLCFAFGAAHLVMGILHVAYYGNHSTATKRLVGSSFYAMVITNGVLAIVNGLIMVGDGVHSVAIMADISDMDMFY